MAMAPPIEFMPQHQDLRFAYDLPREPEDRRFDPLQVLDPEASDLAEITQSFILPRRDGALGPHGLFGEGYRTEESFAQELARRADQAKGRTWDPRITRSGPSLPGGPGQAPRAASPRWRREGSATGRSGGLRHLRP